MKLNSRQLLCFTSLLFLCGVVVACQTARQHTFVDSQLSPRLIRPIAFVDFSVVGNISSNGVQRLFNEKVSIGSNDADYYEFLKVPGESETRLRVETVQQYLAARKTGAFPYNTFEITMDGFFADAAIALLFLKQSKPAETNNLAADYLLRLGVGFLSWREENERLLSDVGHLSDLK